MFIYIHTIQCEFIINTLAHSTFSAHLSASFFFFFRSFRISFLILPLCMQWQVMSEQRIRKKN